MPELPEVEIVCRTLRRHLPGKKISKVEVLNRGLRRRVARNFARLLQGRTIKAVERRAKYIVCPLDDGRLWVTHLGMSGRLLKAKEGQKADKHTCVVLHLSDGSRILHRDVRRFGLALVGSESELDVFEQLGVEPLGDDLTAPYLFACCQKTTRKIKDVLMDQRIVAGLGNIYVNEALFKARVHPLSLANVLPRRKVTEMTKAIKDVLREAIEDGGSSISDFMDGDGKEGSHQEHFLVYNKEAKPCRRCKAPIERIQHGGRSSFVCPHCQKIVP